MWRMGFLFPSGPSHVLLEWSNRGRVKALLQLRSVLFVILFSAYTKDQSAAVSVSLDFKISSFTHLQPGLPPFQRTTTGLVPAPSRAHRCPHPVGTAAGRSQLSNSTSCHYTTWTTFPSFSPSSLWQPQALWVFVFLSLWCCLAA